MGVIASLVELMKAPHLFRPDSSIQRIYQVYMLHTFKFISTMCFMLVHIASMSRIMC